MTLCCLDWRVSTGCRVALLLLSLPIEWMYDRHSVKMCFIVMDVSQLTYIRCYRAGWWVLCVQFEVCWWMFQIFCWYQVEIAMYEFVALYRLVLMFSESIIATIIRWWFILDREDWNKLDKKMEFNDIVAPFALFFWFWTFLAISLGLCVFPIFIYELSESLIITVLWTDLC